MPDARGEVTVSRLASYSSRMPVAPSSSTSRYLSSGYTTSRSSFRTSSLDRSYSSSHTSTSRFTPSSSSYSSSRLSSRPPLPSVASSSSDYRSRRYDISSSSTRASPARAYSRRTSEISDSTDAVSRRFSRDSGLGSYTGESSSAVCDIISRRYSRDSGIGLGGSSYSGSSRAFRDGSEGKDHTSSSKYSPDTDAILAKYSRQRNMSEPCSESVTDRIRSFEGRRQGPQDVSTGTPSPTAPRNSGSILLNGFTTPSDDENDTSSLRRQSVAELRKRYDSQGSTRQSKNGSDDEEEENEDVPEQRSLRKEVSPLVTERERVRGGKQTTDGSPSPTSLTPVDIDSPSTSRRPTTQKDSPVSSPLLSRRSKKPSESGVSLSESSGLVGLRNIGNTCFMNSVLQCLSNTRPLLEYIMKDGYTNELNTTISSMKGALIQAFGNLLGELWKSGQDEHVVTTAPFKSQVQRFAPRFMGYSQQDAQEFLRYLLEGLHEDVNRVTARPKPITSEIDDSLLDSQKAAEAWKRYLRVDNSKIVDLFVGQLKSTLRCTTCGHESVTFDPFWDLSLPIPSRVGQVRLQQCFDLFTKEEVLDGDEKPTCSKCKTRRKCTKSFSIQRFPRILVLHLKRFSPTERFRGKLSCTVDFPLKSLDLGVYASNSGQGQPSRYDLYGVANHSGTTYSGHYTAYCRHPYSGEWHEYNDSRVSSVSMKSIVSNEAYVLFFEMASSAATYRHRL